jgi:O-antigen/teichoic acid export membrane protein
MLSLMSAVAKRLAVRLLALRILGAGLSFLLGLYIARNYGAATSGAYYLFLSICGAGAMVARLGLDGSMTKYLSMALSSGQHAQANSIWLYCVGISALLGTCFSLGVAFWGDFFLIDSLGADAGAFSRWLMLGLPFLALQHINFTALRCLDRQMVSSVMETIPVPAGTVILLMLGLTDDFGNPSLRVVSAFVISTVIVSTASGLAVINKMLWRAGFGSIPRRAMWQVAKHLFLISVVGYVTESISTYMLTAYASLEQVGVFNVALRLVILTGMAVNVSDGMNAPKFSVLYRENKIREIEVLVSRTTAFNLLIGAGPLLVLFIFPSWVLSHFGPSFVTGAGVLRILVLGQLSMLACGAVGYLLLMAGKERKVLVSWGWSLAVQISVLGLTVQELGAEGAAWAWTSALLLRNALAASVSARELRVRLLPMAWRSVR